MNPDLYAVLLPEDLAFCSPAFLFVFMPLFFLIYYLSKPGLRNVVLLLTSLLFYYINAGAIIIVLVGSIGLNHMFAKLIARGKYTKLMLAFGLFSNLLPLLYYKYWSFMLSTTFDVLNLFGTNTGFELTHILLPAGISFFTFQGMSYLVDVYRKDVTPLRSIIDFGMYHTLFPQLIAGPIVRYAEIEQSVTARTITLEMIHAGIVCFMLGVGKKIILGDNAGHIADNIFALSHEQLSTSLAWLGAAAYSLQIFFDFSGYSDMAIGMGMMLGFRFPQNFNQPYISRSITEFWRRWHMTLSRWFRDYLYIPLGGNRKSKLRTYLNLFTVFFLCGLWHGAGWPFIFWGIYHGTLLVFERLIYGKADSPLHWVIGWPLTLLLVMIGWVLFRSSTLSDAFYYLSVMFGNDTTKSVVFPPSFYLTPNRLTFLLIAFLIAVFPTRSVRSHKLSVELTSTISTLGSFAVFFYAIILVTSNGFNPFIYYRF